MTVALMRHAVAGDGAFVRNPWIEIGKMRINWLVKNARVVVACDPADPDTLAGCMVHEGPVLHFIYVKSHMRGLGIARELLQSVTIERYTWTNPLFERRIKPKDRGWLLVGDDPERTKAPE